MPKRNRDASPDNIEYYKRKIKKLEDQQKRNYRRIVIESSSESDVNASSDAADVLPDAENSGGTLNDPVSTTEAALPSEETDNGVELDPELLVALGEETGSDPKFGEKIHQSLAQRWEPVLKKGLLKETKDKLLKEYLVPENCTLLQAPKLNREVAAAISEASRQRDKRKESEQQQLGVGISAINKALTLMLTSDNKIEAIRLISDGCRILTDLHYQETQGRISVINYALAKPFLSIVQDGERDDTLYGNKLAEKIKASKTIEKQGLSIKKFIKVPKNTSTMSEQGTSSTRFHNQYRHPGSYQGNWSGPSRFQQSRGGRRGSGRTYTPATSRRYPQQQHQAASATSSNKTKQPATRQ